MLDKAKQKQMLVKSVISTRIPPLEDAFEKNSSRVILLYNGIQKRPGWTYNEKILELFDFSGFVMDWNMFWERRETYENSYLYADLYEICNTI